MPKRKDGKTNKVRKDKGISKPDTRRMKKCDAPECDRKTLLKNYLCWYCDPAKRADRALKQRGYVSANLDDVRRRQRLINRRARGIINPTDEVKSGDCPICTKYCDRLYLDHFSVTGQIRGWICNGCNRGLGRFADSPGRLRRAAEYLEKSGQYNHDNCTYISEQTRKQNVKQPHLAGLGPDLHGPILHDTHTGTGELVPT